MPNNNVDQCQLTILSKGEQCTKKVKKEENGVKFEYCPSHVKFIAKHDIDKTCDHIIVRKIAGKIVGERECGKYVLKGTNRCGIQGHISNKKCNFILEGKSKCGVSTTGKSTKCDKHKISKPCEVAKCKIRAHCEHQDVWRCKKHHNAICPPSLPKDFKETRLINSDLKVVFDDLSKRRYIDLTIGKNKILSIEVVKFTIVMEKDRDVYGIDLDTLGIAPGKWGTYRSTNGILNNSGKFKLVYVPDFDKKDHKGTDGTDGENALEYKYHIIADAVRVNILYNPANYEAEETSSYVITGSTLLKFFDDICEKQIDVIYKGIKKNKSKAKKGENKISLKTAAYNQFIGENFTESEEKNDFITYDLTLFKKNKQNYGHIQDVLYAVVRSGYFKQSDESIELFETCNLEGAWASTYSTDFKFVLEDAFLRATYRKHSLVNFKYMAASCLGEKIIVSELCKSIEKETTVYNVGFDESITVDETSETSEKNVLLHLFGLDNSKSTTKKYINILAKSVPTDEAQFKNAERINVIRKKQEIFEQFGLHTYLNKNMQIE